MNDKLIRTIIISVAIVTSSYLLSHPVIEVVGKTFTGWQGGVFGKHNDAIEIRMKK